MSGPGPKGGPAPFTYYAERLAGERLRLVYEIASARIRQYLDAEIRHVVSRLPAGASVLELGCGYGRAMRELAGHATLVVGVDTAITSLAFARRFFAPAANVRLVAMDAVELGFDRTYDVVCCVQNGICAFHVDRRRLLEAAVEAARPGGRVLFSTYAEEFWPHRLEWFRAQAAHGLIGPIDEVATGKGVIVCKDGFTATTVSPGELAHLAAGLGRRADVTTVDGSSVFCEIAV